MSRATISTGRFSFDASSDAERARSDAEPGYVLVLGDFSGSASRGEVATPRLRAIDRDNFDELFAELNVRLQLPLCEEPLAFSGLDELHPDFLYEHVDLFARLRGLERRLRNRDTFAAAAAELGVSRPDAAPQQTLSLDDLLSNSHSSPSSPLDIQRLIADIVAPHVIPAPDPQLGSLLQSVSDAIGETMRKLMHQSAFQSLEANWRGLYLLTRRVDSDREPKFLLLDCTRAQLPTLLAQGGEFDQLLQKAGRVDTPPRLIVSAFNVDDDLADIDAAKGIAEFADRHDSLAVAAGSPALAGCADLHADPEQWQVSLDDDVDMSWRALRASTAAQSLLLTAPRFLLRLPYGKRTSPTERFAFEEAEGDGVDRYQLWGSGAWLVALALLNDESRVDSLPLPLSGDDERAACCTEVLLHDRAAAHLKMHGLLPLRVVRGEDAVLMSEWVAVAAQSE